MLFVSLICSCYSFHSLSVRSTVSSGYDSSESGSGSESGVGGKYDLISQGATSPILRRHHKENRDLLVS